jgi:cytochrome c peroxidase
MIPVVTIRKIQHLLVAALNAWMIITLIGCELEEVDVIAESVIQSEAYVLEFGDFPAPAIPKDNPLTMEGVKLGRMLFYEPMLSSDNSISCASCHKQEFAFSDTARYSIGVNGMHGKRNSMSIVNMAWQREGFFWDGRAHTLREQSLFPIQDKAEMNETLDNVVAKLSANTSYASQFESAFGDQLINADRISLALEQFMLSIVSNQSKYDAFLAGKAQLNPAEDRGRVLFFSERNPFFPALPAPNCTHCHQGHNLSADRFINNGLADESGMQDLGRQQFTGELDDLGRFKVPTLRNIALTAPYMHDGRFQTLEEVINHYDHGIHPSATLDPALEKQLRLGLQLTEQDKADIIAFLHTLTDPHLVSNPHYAYPF